MNTMSTVNAKSVCIVGGGAAGLFAAAELLRSGVNVTIFEHKNETGKKLLITGKGRCNLTNDCTPEEFLAEVTRNPRFLMSAIHRCPPSYVMRFFEEHGLPLKTERGRRVFPVSDKAKDVVNVLRRATKNAKIVNEKVLHLVFDEKGICGVRTQHAFYPFDFVLIATGGRSYPLTGSDGSGYALAKEAGHEVTPLIPSLVPLESSASFCAELQGVAPKNVSLTICERESGRVLYRDFGEMLFTHFGISGPMVISASAHLRDVDIAKLDAVIDWKSALDEKTLDARLLSDFAANANRDFANSLSALLPARVIPTVVSMTGIDPHKKVNTLTKAERHKLRTILKNFRIPLLKTRPIEEAIVTSGGVNVKEIDPKTMMSRKADALFFAGEILDVDAYTGGYNLQIAFSTAFVAAKAIEERCQSDV